MKKTFFSVIIAIAGLILIIFDAIIPLDSRSLSTTNPTKISF
jgi:uncharacterized alpha/beta hydrolase family protein